MTVLVSIHTGQFVSITLPINDVNIYWVTGGLQQAFVDFGLAVLLSARLYLGSRISGIIGGTPNLKSTEVCWKPPDSTSNYQYRYQYHLHSWKTALVR